MLLLAENLPDSLGCLLKFLVIFLVQFNVIVAFEVVQGDRDHQERKHGGPLQPELFPHNHERSEGAQIVHGRGRPQEVVVQSLSNLRLRLALCFHLHVPKLGFLAQDEVEVEH